MLELAKLLIEKLNENNIRYCHWKSNFLLNEALNGYDDLDLLISRKAAIKFEEIIFSLGFKEASNKNISFSSIKHFYGFDNKSGKILHLHIYYQIKTGPSWTKSIRFDFEDYILNNLIIHESGMPVPEKYIELVIFIFRVMLKYSKINEFILINKENKRTLKEINYLIQNLNNEKLKKFLEKYFPNISKEEFFNYINIIKNGSKLEKYLKGKILKRKLKRYYYMSLFEENFNNIYQLIYRLINKFFLKQKKKLQIGGIFIVVAGLDATGKTTITNELNKWLGKNFTVHLIHFGKPPSTFLTYPFNFFIRLMRKKSNNSNLRSSINKANKPRSLLFIFRQIILAYDRYRLSKKYWNKVCKGDIVICDRYKSENYNVMDSKRLDPTIYKGFKRKLAILENKLYDIMPEPDILFYLIVPVDVAVKRNEERIKKGKETAEFIKLRHQQNKDLKYNSKNFYIIDTNREYNLVINEIKFKIWSII